MRQAEAECVCGYVSTTKNIARHIRTCTARPFAIRNKELEQALSEKQAEIDKLTKENGELRGRPTTINYNNNSVNVNILAYGQEPLPNTHDVRNILLPPETSIARYIALKHFRDPSTSNVRISNKKAKTIQVVEPDVNSQLRWTEKNRKEMIEKMVDENIDELTETHGAAKVERWRRWYETSGLEEPGYDKTDTYKRIERDVENMLLSQRNLPL
tara:strand:- start:5599 stop:6240 length:642 start_codon:yes stop_codon:yes gene_type:complete